MKNEEGFTLLETLIVLLVSSLLLMVPTLSMSKMVERMEIDLFFRELTSNITLMQNHSILSGDRTKISFYVERRGDIIDFVAAGTNHPLNRRMYLDSPHYRFKSPSSEYFRFNGGTGNITKSDTVLFLTSQGEYKLTYLLGSGRFDIKEVK